MSTPAVYWRSTDKRIVFYQGDCLEVMAALPSRSMDLVFADPPFNINCTYDVYDDRMSKADYVAWSNSWIRAAVRLLKDNGSFWVAIGDEYAAELKLILDSCGLTMRNWVIWHYTFGVNCTRKFNRSHVHLLYYVVNPKEFAFQKEEVRVPSARQRIYKDSRANGAGRLPDDVWVLRPQETEEFFTQQGDVWYQSRICGTFKERTEHPCQMPVEILERIVRVSCPVGGVVLDPFLGSGTTAVAAWRNKRRCYGIELSEKYLQEIAVPRLVYVQSSGAESVYPRKEADL